MTHGIMTSKLLTGFAEMEKEELLDSVFQQGPFISATLLRIKSDFLKEPVFEDETRVSWGLVTDFRKRRIHPAFTILSCSLNVR